MGRISGLGRFAPEGGAVSPREIDAQAVNVQTRAGEDRRYRRALSETELDGEAGAGPHQPGDVGSQGAIGV